LLLIILELHTSMVAEMAVVISRAAITVSMNIGSFGSCCNFISEVMRRVSPEIRLMEISIVRIIFILYNSVVFLPRVVRHLV